MAHGGTCACAMRLPYQGMRRSLPLDFYQHLWRSKPVLAFQPVTSILISIYIGPSIKCNSRFTLPSPPPPGLRTVYLAHHSAMRDQPRPPHTKRHSAKYTPLEARWTILYQYSTIPLADLSKSFHPTLSSPPLSSFRIGT